MKYRGHEQGKYWGDSVDRAHDKRSQRQSERQRLDELRDTFNSGYVNHFDEDIEDPQAAALRGQH